MITLAFCLIATQAGLLQHESHQNIAFILLVFAVLHRAIPVAAAVVEFAGGPHAWVTRTYSASKGEGAFCNGKALKVTTCTDVSQSLLVSDAQADTSLRFD